MVAIILIELQAAMSRAITPIKWFREVKIISTHLRYRVELFLGLSSGSFHR